MYAKLYGEIEGAAAQLSQASLEEKPRPPSKKQKQRQIIVKITDRNKRKHVTTISGLDMYEVDIKKLSKECSKKFACSSSVNKNAEGKEEVIIQGDVGDGVIKLLTDNYKVPEDEITRKEK